MELFRIPMEIDMAYPAMFIFYDEQGKEVERVPFQDMSREEIHDTLRQRGFLPMRE